MHVLLAYVCRAQYALLPGHALRLCAKNASAGTADLGRPERGSQCTARRVRPRAIQSLQQSRRTSAPPEKKQPTAQHPGPSSNTAPHRAGACAGGMRMWCTGVTGSHTTLARGTGAVLHHLSLHTAVPYCTGSTCSGSKNTWRCFCSIAQAMHAASLRPALDLPPKSTSYVKGTSQVSTCMHCCNKLQRALRHLVDWYCVGCMDVMQLARQAVAVCHASNDSQRST